MFTRLLRYMLIAPAKAVLSARYAAADFIGAAIDTSHPACYRNADFDAGAATVTPL